MFANGKDLKEIVILAAIIATHLPTGRVSIRAVNAAQQPGNVSFHAGLHGLVTRNHHRSGAGK
jgi:hypothetical protein